MGAERQRWRRAPRRACASGGGRRLHRLFRIRRRALCVWRAHHHRKLALRLFRHVAARQPDPLAARRRRGGGARPRPPMGHRRIGTDGDRSGGGPHVSVDRVSLPDGPSPRPFAPAARDLAAALRFFTRLRAGAPSDTLDINRIAWAAPVAGAAVGLIGSLILALATVLGLPPLLRAGLATAALIAITGALH